MKTKAVKTLGQRWALLLSCGALLLLGAGPVYAGGGQGKTSQDDKSLAPAPQQPVDEKKPIAERGPEERLPPKEGDGPILEPNPGKPPTEGPLKRVVLRPIPTRYIDEAFDGIEDLLPPDLDLRDAGGLPCLSSFAHGDVCSAVGNVPGGSCPTVDTLADINDLWSAGVGAEFGGVWSKAPQGLLPREWKPDGASVVSKAVAVMTPQPSNAGSARVELATAPLSLATLVQPDQTKLQDAAKKLFFADREKERDLLRPDDPKEGGDEIDRIDRGPQVEFVFSEQSLDRLKTLSGKRISLKTRVGDLPPVTRRLDDCPFSPSNPPEPQSTGSVSKTDFDKDLNPTSRLEVRWSSPEDDKSIEIRRKTQGNEEILFFELGPAADLHIRRWNEAAQGGGIGDKLMAQWIDTTNDLANQKAAANEPWDANLWEQLLDEDVDEVCQEVASIGRVGGQADGDNGNNGPGNGVDAQPPGNPPINDDQGDAPGAPGNGPG